MFLAIKKFWNGTSGFRAINNLPHAHWDETEFSPNAVSVQVWSKSSRWFTKQTAEKAHFYSPNCVVTLKSKI